MQREAQTSPGGTYEIPSLPVGTYDITFLKDGFKAVTVKSVVLMNGQSRTVDGRLEVGATTDAVQVTASAELVNATDAEVGGVVESAEINSIPLSGRNWATLMLLAPGAVNYGDGSQRSIRFNNHSIDDTNYQFDGIDATGVQEQAQKTTTRLQISPDAIEEFRVSTSNYSAESGSNGGAQVNVVTKTGANSFHGNASGQAAITSVENIHVVRILSAASPPRRRTCWAASPSTARCAPLRWAARLPAVRSASASWPSPPSSRR